jgi:hypothetical protein
MNAKKSHRICVPDRSRLSEGIAQRREYARNYARIRKAIRKVLDECWDRADGDQFSAPINTTVRELVGCRITEIGDGDIEVALACVNAMRHLITGFDRHCKREACLRERDQREREQHASNGNSAWYNNLVREIKEIVDHPRDAPSLSLVPDCGRDLAPSEHSSSPGPHAA